MMNAPFAELSAQPRVDTHAHVFTRSLPLVDGRRYAPNYDAPLSTYRTLLDKHDIENAVLVQPSFLGTDNSYLLRALATDRARLRGVAVVSPDISEADLTALNTAGITGVRLNLIGQTLPDIGSIPYVKLWRRLAKLGWHVELHRRASDLVPLIRPLLNEGLPVVVDHFGRPDLNRGVGDPGFKKLLEFGASGRVWIKLSAAYRCAKPNSGFAREATGQIMDAFGVERIMWGSDWPHTQFEGVTDFGNALSTLLDLDLETQYINTILRTTPRLFYGFGGDPISVNISTAPFSQLTL